MNRVSMSPAGIMRTALVTIALALAACSGASTTTETPTTTASDSPTTNYPVVDVPTWAAPLDSAGYQSFLEALEADLTGRGLDYSLDLGEGSVVLSDGTRFGLVNLVQTLASAGSDQASVIAAHFDTIMEILSADLGDGALRIRLYPSTFPAELECGTVGDIKLVPVEDFPGTARGIILSRLAELGRELPELCDEALESTLLAMAETIEVSETTVAGVPIFEFGGDFYSSTAALDPSRFVGMPPAGAVVFLPVSTNAIVVPLTGPEVSRAFSTLSEVTSAWFADGPRSLSTSMFWWDPQSGLKELPDEDFDALFPN